MQSGDDTLMKIRYPHVVTLVDAKAWVSPLASKILGVEVSNRKLIGLILDSDYR